MKAKLIAVLAFAVAVGFASAAMADQYNFSFNGNGITASGTLTTSPGAAAGVYDITKITGTFSDSNVNVSGTINDLYQPVSYVSDDLDPNFAFTTGGLSYDDTFYPAGNSPAICYALINGVKTLTYPFSGGLLDIFGVTFNVSGGYVAEIWSNGDVGNGPIIYAAGLANATSFVDNPNAVPGPNVPPPGRYGTFTASTPEPASLVLFGFGLLGVAALWLRKNDTVRLPR